MNEHSPGAKWCADEYHKIRQAERGDDKIRDAVQGKPTCLQTKIVKGGYGAGPFSEERWVGRLHMPCRGRKECA
jgi:hypothetical protein